ncbi:hypothetical protein PENTCL1PPCAC_17192, partial [Pristionchus entomophagus]
GEGGRMTVDHNDEVIETTMLDRPTRLFPDRARLESISEDEGIFFHVPLSPSVSHLSPVASHAHIGSPSMSSIPSFSTIVLAETPGPSIMKRSNRLCFDNISLESGRDRDGRPLTKAQMRLKSLKSMKRHTRSRGSITLREEDEEEDPVPDVGATIVNQQDEKQEVNQNEENEDMKPHWITNREATSNFVSFVSFLYALLAIVYLTVEETTYEENSVDGSIFPSGTAFHYYMYSVGIGFMVYVNLFIIHPPWFNRILYYLEDKGLWRNAEKYVIMPAAHNAHPVSSLYLRLGTALFGCGGVVLFGLELFLLFSNKATTSHCGSSSAENILGAVFTFLQMYFMNVNYKLSIDSSPNVCRFGFMHNFALNLWIWHRYSTAKQHEHVSKQSIKERDERDQKKMDRMSSAEYFNDYSNIVSNFTEYRSSSEEYLQRVLPSTTTTIHPGSNHYVDRMTHGPHNARGNTSTEEYQNIIAVLEYFGDFAGFLDTCLIEYSVIGATIMFVFWRHLDAPTKSSERKQSFRMDFTHTFTGFHCGVVLFVIGAVVCGVYSALVNDKDPDAYLLLGIYQSVCFGSCIVAVVLAVIFMRTLVLSENGHTEDVDRILLYIAFVGELLWCSADLSRFIDGEAGDQGGFIFAVTLLRLLHIFVQTWFILMAAKLELSSSTNVSAMKGRQCVTFLLVVNLTLFFFNIYSSMTDGFGYVSPLTSNHSYIKLLSEPLITFYRFHSTVCLAEIWKKSFSRPKAHHSHISIS